ncbi:MAG: Re/Si-specific NAD(P)(+) transhydrogenase subunit alpha [Chloroflexia bacterium]|nr:Re/Si-specific NAD(P)(+) transhydrogenase subunit alpha [Chloroflexia bacterium]
MAEEAAGGARVTIGVPRETAAGEHRVALVPDAVKRLVGAGAVVAVEAGAGVGASFADAEYAAVGATIVPDAATLYGQADLVVKVQRPQADPATGSDEIGLLREGSTLIALLSPLSNPDLVQTLADKRVTSYSMDAIPRITRAQSMDVLSSQATVSGYKAVLLAATYLPKFFPMLTTAAGSITPAKVLIVGAGVAGLQAIATARRLGAVVEAYDTRPVVKEQVESLGAKFVEIDVDTSDAQTAGGYAKEVSAETLRKQQEVLADRAARSDVVITTALVPGRPAPKLISAETVGRMRAGSVIVDLAAETGGNCELTVPGEVAEREGVTIVGLLNLPSSMPVHASQMYSKNLQNLLDLLVKQGRYAPDDTDEIVKGTRVTLGGEVVHAATRQRLTTPPPVAVAAPAEAEAPAPTPVEAAAPAAAPSPTGS